MVSKAKGKVTAKARPASKAKAALPIKKASHPAKRASAPKAAKAKPPHKAKAVPKAPAPRKGKISDAGLARSQATLKVVLKTLDDGQADQIVTIDLVGKHSLIDYMIVASGRSSRQVAALADNLRAALHKNGVRSVRIEGMQQADWVLVDGGDLIVHLFRPEVRAFYNLEKMWLADANGLEPHENLMVR